MKSQTISAVVITKNNQDKIEECINSLNWTDEIVIVDTGSTDKTIDIIKKYKCSLYKYPKGSYADWRNFALNKVKTDWVLYVDSDERVTLILRDEILALIKSGVQYGCYVIPRLNNVMGVNLRHGGWYPDHVKRLFLRKNIKKWVGELHEEPIFEGEIYKLRSHFIHIKEQTLDAMVEKTNKWSNVEAKLMFEADHPKMDVARFITAMFREFWYRFVVKLGFLDGKVGIIFNTYQIYSKFISYAKLWEMQLKDTNIRMSTNDANKYV